MLKVVWNIIKSLLGVVFSIFRPAKRLICRRRKLSGSDDVELTSVSTGESHPINNSFGHGKSGDDEPEIEMEAWDAWENSGGQASGPGGDLGQNGVGVRKTAGSSTINNYFYNKKLSEPEPEPQMNFFEDMTPDVKKQRKILVRKKDAHQHSDSPPVSSRLGVMSDVPLQASSELQSWDDANNAWDTGEAAEDLTWQAEEAIKEKKKRERVERQMEQQKRKQKKDEMRGLKSGHHLATKLS